MAYDLINVAGTDSRGRLQVFVTNPSDMKAVDRARLYHAAPKLLAALRHLVHEIRNADPMLLGALEQWDGLQVATEESEAAIAKANGITPEEQE